MSLRRLAWGAHVASSFHLWLYEEGQSQMWYPYRDQPMANHSSGPEPPQVGNITVNSQGYWKLVRQQQELIAERKHLLLRIKELEQENERLRSAPSGTPRKPR